MKGKLFNGFTFMKDSILRIGKRIEPQAGSLLAQEKKKVSNLSLKWNLTIN